MTAKKKTTANPTSKGGKGGKKFTRGGAKVGTARGSSKKKAAAPARGDATSPKLSNERNTGTSRGTRGAGRATPQHAEGVVRLAEAPTKASGRRTSGASTRKRAAKSGRDR